MPDRRTELMAILGLCPDAGAADARRAFRRLVLELHPDRRGGDREAAARLSRVIDAYEAVFGTRPQRVRRRHARPASRTAAPSRPAPPPPRGPFVCPRCQDSYGALGECPRCALFVAPVETATAAPDAPEVEAMIAALEARRPSELPPWLATRVPIATIAALLLGGALALPIHVPAGGILVGYALLLVAGESMSRPW